MRRSARYPLAAGFVVVLALLALQAGFARSAFACATTSYWNVSFNVYNPHTGCTRTADGPTQYDRLSWDSNATGFRKWLHTTGGGTWLEAQETYSDAATGDNTWVFYFVAGTDKIGCFNPVDSNTWVNCRRCSFVGCTS
jgi:hypothetical protein